MRSKLFLLLFAPLFSFAQVNDMFYVPKKEVKMNDVEKYLSGEDDWGVADNGNDRDVDEYNRRVKVVPRNSGTVVEDVYVDDADIYTDNVYNETIYVDDYDYSTRIVRFHSPTRVIVRGPWYWDRYYSPYYYDSFWDTHWDYMWHYNGCDFGFHATWHPSWWYPAPPPHKHHHHKSWSTSARRIPIASPANKGGNGRVPVANVAGGKNNKQPVGGKQVNNGRNERRNSSGKVANSNRSVSERRVVNGNNRNSNRNVQRNSSAPSTYNRRSSTSVNRSTPSRSVNRTPVSRGGTSRSGVSRSGRR